MANIRTIKAHFSDNEKYFENTLGGEYYYTEATGPYEYLLGALAGCYCFTLYSQKRKSNWKSLDITVTGKKRIEIPTTLEETTLKIIAKGVEDKEEFLSLTRRASEECSIYQTISKVSRMKLEVLFED